MIAAHCQLVIMFALSKMTIADGVASIYFCLGLHLFRWECISSNNYLPTRFTRISRYYGLRIVRVYSVDKCYL